MSNYQQHLSQHQYTLISKLILGANDLSLAEIDKNMAIHKEKVKKLTHELDIFDRAEYVGICLRILNDIRQNSDADTLTTEQKDIIKNYDIMSLQAQNESFYQEIKRRLEAEKSTLEDLEKIRAVFVEHYPEAHTSPRLSRQSLERSPTRHLSLEDDHKKTLTDKKGNTTKELRRSASTLMSSPRRLLSSSSSSSITK